MIGNSEDVGVTSDCKSNARSRSVIVAVTLRREKENSLSWICQQHYNYNHKIIGL